MKSILLTDHFNRWEYNMVRYEKLLPDELALLGGLHNLRQRAVNNGWYLDAMFYDGYWYFFALRIGIYPNDVSDEVLQERTERELFSLPVHKAWAVPNNIITEN